VGWKELSEKLQDARIKKRIPLKELSMKTNISIDKLKKMEKGDFSIESPIYIKNYLKRLSAVLQLDESDLIEDYESETRLPVSNEKEKPSISYEVLYYVMVAVLSIFVIVLLVEIERELTLPYATLYNSSDATLLVNGRPLSPYENYKIFKDVKVTNNSSVVTIKEYSGRILKIKIKDFEVNLYGKSKNP